MPHSPRPPGGGHRHFPYRRPPLSTILESVFDTDRWWGTRITYASPQRVWLYLAHALPPQRVSNDDVPLRVRAAGIDLARELPAELHAWQQTSTGDWFGEVQTVLVNRNGLGKHETQLLVPASAVRPRNEP